MGFQVCGLLEELARGSWGWGRGRGQQNGRVRWGPGLPWPSLSSVPIRAVPAEQAARRDPQGGLAWASQERQGGRPCSGARLRQAGPGSWSGSRGAVWGWASQTVPPQPVPGRVGTPLRSVTFPQSPHPWFRFGPRGDPSPARAQAAGSQSQRFSASRPEWDRVPVLPRLPGRLRLGRPPEHGGDGVARQGSHAEHPQSRAAPGGGLRPDLASPGSGVSGSCAPPAALSPGGSGPEAGAPASGMEVSLPDTSLLCVRGGALGEENLT